MAQIQKKTYLGDVHEIAGTEVTISSAEISTLPGTGSPGLHDSDGTAIAFVPAPGTA
jgi:hypothetical protein